MGHHFLKPVIDHLMTTNSNILITQFWTKKKAFLMPIKIFSARHNSWNLSRKRPACLCCLSASHHFSTNSYLSRMIHASICTKNFEQWKEDTSLQIITKICEHPFLEHASEVNNFSFSYMIHHAVLLLIFLSFLR